MNISKNRQSKIAVVALIIMILIIMAISIYDAMKNMDKGTPAVIEAHPEQKK